MKMSDNELEQLLKQAEVPERVPAYWETFASRVKRELVRSQRADERGEAVRLIPGLRFSLVVWGVGVASACIVFGLLIGFRKENANAATQLASMQKYYQEVSALFPNQIQAVVLDENGPRLILSEAANVPNSNPIFLTICQAKYCQKFITFSGQQIQVNAEKCDVLADAHGNVILAGQKLIWNSASTETAGPGYRIQAQLLERSL